MTIVHSSQVIFLAQVAVVTKLQSLLYPPPPTPADVADAERTVEENFRRLAKQRCALYLAGFAVLI